MDQTKFEESVKKFINENYEKADNNVISTLCSILVEIHYNLNLKAFDNTIDDISIVISTKPELLYDSFYKTFKMFRDKYKDSTFRNKLCIVRNALGKLGANKKKLKVPSREKEIKVKEEEIYNLFPKILKNCNNKELLKFIENRFHKAVNNTGCKSIQSKKIMLRHWGKLLCVFGNLEELKIIELDFSFDVIIDKMNEHIKTSYDLIYLHHLFYRMNDEWDIKIKELKTYFEIEDKLDIDKDGDKDFLTPIQQENIWKAAKNTLEKLFISLLFTTGLRIGGLCNIKIEDIYDKVNDEVKDFGSVVEKGSKIRRFPIFDMVKKPLHRWIEQNKILKSPFLFHGMNDHNKPRSTRYFQLLFKEIAKRCGYDGDEIHVHAIRHSVARNLLESGNSMEEIGKFLGHANPMTTAKFYANLSTKETIDRMDTTAIGGTNKKGVHVPQIPNFNTKKKKKRNKMAEAMLNTKIGKTSIKEDRKFS